MEQFTRRLVWAVVDAVLVLLDSKERWKEGGREREREREREKNEAMRCREWRKIHAQIRTRQRRM